MKVVAVLSGLLGLVATSVSVVAQDVSVHGANTVTATPLAPADVSVMGSWTTTENGNGNVDISVVGVESIEE